MVRARQFSLQRQTDVTSTCGEPVKTVVAWRDGWLDRTKVGMWYSLRERWDGG